MIKFIAISTLTILSIISSIQIITEEPTQTEPTCMTNAQTLDQKRICSNNARIL